LCGAIVFYKTVNPILISVKKKDVFEQRILKNLSGINNEIQVHPIKNERYEKI
jgi:hypothetical protein